MHTPDSGSNSHIYKFGPFLFDPKGRLLTKNGVKVPLRSRLVTTLRVFLEHSGEELSKDQLMDLIWPNTIVEEANLYSAISDLRKCLGVSKDDDPYFSTVSGVGYAFIAEVLLVSKNEIIGETVVTTTTQLEFTHDIETEIEDGASTPEPTTQPIITVDPSPKPLLLRVAERIGIRQRTLVATMALFALALPSGWFAYTHFRNSIIAPEEAVRHLEISTLFTVNNEGATDLSSPHLSPDGEYIAFVSSKNGHQIMLTPSGENKPHPLSSPGY